MYGWMGRILRVNLGTKKIDALSTQDYLDYLGGRGIGTRLYRENVGNETMAFDEANCLVFMTGPLVGTGAQGATRMSVTGKSPMTCPEGFCYGNIGGFVGAELKRAGYDGLVVTGRAAGPVYLWINDDTVVLKDAAALWGQGAYRTAEMIRELHGEKARFLTTGIAGENLVRSAIIFGSHQSTSTAGFGAVMGSKNLKAIVVRGIGRPKVAHPDLLKELNRHTIEVSKRLELSIPPDVTMSGHGHLLERIGKGGCDQCGLDCIRNKYRFGQRSDLEDYRRCQSMEYYLPWRFSQEDEPVETFYNAPVLANDYSICTFELRNIISWLYACRQAGALSDEDTGLPLSRIGTGEFLEKLIHAIAHREGFGAVLAEGLYRAAEKLPAAARALISPGVLPVGETDVNLPRLAPVYAILEPMEPRMSRPLVHGGFARAAWSLGRMNPEKIPVTSAVFKEIARAFWGSEDAADYSTCRGKALAAVKIQDRACSEDILGLCDFAWPLAFSFSKPGLVGEPDLEARLFSAVTGRDGGEIELATRRTVNLQRMIMIGEGRNLPEDDYPPEINFTQPLPPGPQDLMPGPGDEPVNMAGRVLDREDYIMMLREYYQLRGWNEETGVPLAGTLNALAMEDAADNLP